MHAAEGCMASTINRSRENFLKENLTFDFKYDQLPSLFHKKVQKVKQQSIK